MLIDLNKKLFTLNAVITEPLPPIEWDVEGLIAHGNRIVVYGEFGCGKSWMLLDLAIHLALGKSWLDRFAISQPRSVLFLDEEMPGRTLRIRLKKLANGHGFPDSATIPLWLGSHVGLKLSGPHEIEHLLSELNKGTINPDVIIVETLRRVIDGSENDAEDVGRMWEAVEPLLKAEKTLILSHHMRKPSAQGSSLVRHKASGSTDILAGADAGFAVTRTTKDSMIIECVKSRIVEEPPAFSAAVFDLPEKVDAVELRYLATKEETEKDPKLTEVVKSQLRQYMEPGKRYQTKDLENYLEGLAYAKSTIQRAIRECERDGILTNPKRGYWVLPAPVVKDADPPIAEGYTSDVNGIDRWLGQTG